jgi:hypothetical protein
MKTTLFFVAILFCIIGYSQDTAKLKQIDALVSKINTADFKTQRDTIINEQPQLGLSIRTYLTMVIDGTELKKYVNNVHATTYENGITKQKIAINTFYFDENKLIKVEELAVLGDNKMDLLWYYADDKPIYFTLNSDKAEARAELLLTIAKSMLEKIGFK